MDSSGLVKDSIAKKRLKNLERDSLKAMRGLEFFDESLESFSKTFSSP